MTVEDVISVSDITRLRPDFPILFKKVNKRALVYLDNASTTQKPRCVLDSLSHFYASSYASINTSKHSLTHEATSRYESARLVLSDFISASSPDECIFVKGATEGINLVASGFAKSILKPGDEILVSEMEHHANIVPWQEACIQSGASLKVIPVTDSGEIDLHTYENAITKHTRLIAITHVSNVLGTINPIERMVSIAHQYKVPVLVDGAQAVSHMPCNVKKLDCDFYVFSSHKMYGPTGVGLLYGKRAWLEKLPPYQLGADMVSHVSFDKSTYSDLPQRFEAGTPPFVQAIGFAVAAEYLMAVGYTSIQAHEQGLAMQLLNELRAIPQVTILGQSTYRAPIVSFYIDRLDAIDLAKALDQLGITVSTGHHSAQPLITRFKIRGAVRISLGLYNTEAEVSYFSHCLKKVIGIF